MSVVMYDSDVAGDIPVSAGAVAGYGDGEAGTWSEADWARFSVRKLVIVRTFVNAGDVLDLEAGAAVPAQIKPWVVARQQAGVRRPWLYTSRANWQNVLDVVEAELGAGTDVGYWIADWTGGAHSLEGADAVQFANPQSSGGHFDMSLVYGLWPDGSPSSQTPSGPPATQPQPQGEDDVQVPQLQMSSSGGDVKTVQSILNGKAGARLSVDGIFGVATEGAVKAWQTFFHLSVDGIVGPATWTTLLNL